ncbi:MAG: hypothetical protein AAGI49_04730 [Bacteroidota bacterium]
MKKRKIVILGLLLTFWACHTYVEFPVVDESESWRTQKIPAHPQLTQGDPQKGLEYILSGQYVGGGLPKGIVEKRGKKLIDKLGRANELSPNIPYSMSSFTTNDSIEVISGNCFTCHAAPISGEVVYGVGRFASDYRFSLMPFSKIMGKVVQWSYGKTSEKTLAFEDFNRYLQAIAPAVKTDQLGTNPAARLAEACMQHRSADDLTYQATEQYESDDFNIGCDVPPLWHVKKKNALYYTAIGKGDFTKLLMQAAVLGIKDSTEARSIQQNFVDVLAWLRTLEPPAYPYEINEPLAQRGKAIYEKKCSGCHGTYGAEESYPNKVVSVDLIKTDSLYAAYSMTSKITDWYNESWFATTKPQSRLESHYGYIAPPLDGIWATAPYLHNGSVPTIDDLLNSKTRPTYWKRDVMEDYEFDEEKVGWKYTAKNSAGGKKTFDTTLPGYGNMGHYFGDKLDDEARKAVLEYLKTL